jgi:APA family basic amino acid/polyamine antiporter
MIETGDMVTERNPMQQPLDPMQQPLPPSSSGIDATPELGFDGEVITLNGNVQHQQGLSRQLDWKDLICFGVGCTIGAGIFVVTGVVARDKTGPAIFISYILSGFACLISAFSYAEFSGLAPTAGSAYGYTRATLGEYAGWVIGWDLILEYAVSAAGVAQGWSKYLNAFLELFGTRVPVGISTAPWEFDEDTGDIRGTGSAFDLPAVLITIAVTAVLIKGIKESTMMNTAIVVIKIGVILLVIFAGLAFVKAENYTPFMPYGFFGISFFGNTVIGESDNTGNAVGVFAGASIVFFSYIGFDSVTTNAEECKNPQRDLPIGIVGSLAISTVLYVAVSLVLVGMVPYNTIDRSAPISIAFRDVGQHWAEFIIGLGALSGLSSVLLVTLMGQPRIMLAMSRDGLLPKYIFSAIHPIFHTPYRSTFLTGIFVCLVAGLIPQSVVVELVSMGTLLAFAFVNISVIVLRRRQPELHRPFKCPWVPYLPGVGAAFCFLLMLSLPSTNWVRLFIWFTLGQIVYFGYSRRAARNHRNVEKRSPEAINALFSDAFEYAKFGDDDADNGSDFHSDIGGSAGGGAGAGERGGTVELGRLRGNDNDEVTMPYGGDSESKAWNGVENNKNDLDELVSVSLSDTESIVQGSPRGYLGKGRHLNGRDPGGNGVEDSPSSERTAGRALSLVSAAVTRGIHAVHAVAPSSTSMWGASGGQSFERISTAAGEPAP